MAILDFNTPGGLLNLNPSDTGSLGINLSPINEQKIIDEEKREKEDKLLKLRNLADTLRMVNANQSGNTQQSMMFANRLAQRKKDQEARAKEAKRISDMQDYFGNTKYAQMANLIDPRFAAEMRIADENKINTEKGLKEYFGDNNQAYLASKYLTPEVGFQLDQLKIKEEKDKLEKENFNKVAKEIKRKDFTTNREYYQAIGIGYLNAGYIDEALKFLELGKVQSVGDFKKDTLSQRNVVEKQYTPVKENLENFKKLDIALQSDSGTGAYSALLLYLKNLDGSVVKAEEVNSFNQMQGLLGQLEETLSKTKGDGMTSEMRSQIRNIAAEATNLTLKGYEDYLEGSKPVYTALGLDPSLIYGGYTFDRDDYDFNEVDPSFFDGKITGALVD